MSAPRHREVYLALRARISDGELGEGDKLPSETEISSYYEVSRNTVRIALSALIQEGLVRSESGVGTFVRSRRRHEYRPQADLGEVVDNLHADRFLRTERQHDPSQTIDVGLVRCPRYVDKRLGVERGATVASRRRVRLFGGVPYSINDSYYPREVAEGTEIMEPSSIDRGVNTVLTELGHEQVRARDEIYAQMPDPEEIARLDILPGTAVAVHWVIGFTADDRVVRVVRNVLPGDRHVVLFDRVKAGA